MHVFHKFDTEFQLVICVQSAGFKLVVIETKRLTLSNNRSYWNNSMLKKHLAQVANLILSILSDKTITGNTRWMKQTVHWHSLPYVAFVSQTTSALSVAQRAVKSRPIKRIVYEVRRNRWCIRLGTRVSECDTKEMWPYCQQWEFYQKKLAVYGEWSIFLATGWELSFILGTIGYI